MQVTGSPASDASASGEGGREDRRAASIRESGNLAFGGVLLVSGPEGLHYDSPVVLKPSRLPDPGARDAGRRPVKFTPLASIFLFSTLLTHAALAATLTGRVVDPDGRPVPGARVIVAGALGVAAERVADENGAFVLTAIPGGDYEVRVVAAGFQAGPIAVR